MESKKKRRIEYNKKCILDAAKELFKEYGVSKTTVDDIAYEADCSKATIYVYFKNKDDIYYHIVYEYLAKLCERVKQCFSDTEDHEKAYYSLCNVLVQFERKYPMYFEFVLGSISIEPEKMAELPVLRSVFEIGEELNKIVCAFLGMAKRSGFVREDINPLQATFVMWSSICGWITFCSNKQFYIKNSLSMQRDILLKNGFSMILQMVRNEEK